MTRQEFLDEICDMSDLYNFCSENRGYDHVIEEIYSEDALDDFVNNEVHEYTDWRDLYRFLDDIPQGYDWYLIDCYGDITGIDDYEFDNIKSDLLDELDSDEFFDCEDEEEDQEALDVYTTKRLQAKAKQREEDEALSAILCGIA